MKTAEKTAVIFTVLMVIAALAVACASGLRGSTLLPDISLSAPSETIPAFTDGLININTADADALSTLPGVGPALAQRIIDYRQTHGAFINSADIIDVSGIGLKTFEKFKEKITV